MLTEMMESFFLVNIVHNDFHDREAIFKPFFKAGAEAGLQTPLQSPTTEKLTNGVESIALTSAA